MTLVPWNATEQVPRKQLTLGNSLMQLPLLPQVLMMPRVRPVSRFGAPVPGLEWPLATKYGNEPVEALRKLP
ncbi:MAG TPA: hypothetical protein VN408_08320 [Actinoplanes sp.]|nr:hypothetical protein [Actinoplanes sp.]